MLIRLLVPTLLAVIALSQPAAAQTPSNLNEKTIGELINLLNDRAQLIDTAGDASAKIQNIGLAQDQYLLHDIVKHSAEELRYIYGSSLNKPVNGIDAAKRDSLLGFSDQAFNLRYGDDKTVVDDLYKLYSAANKVFDQVLGDGRHPIVYGMRVADLANPGEKTVADLEIFGFDLVTASVNKIPTVTVDTRDAPPDMVSVKDDRLLVEIPQDTKARIHFGQLPCTVRDTFSVLVAVYATEPRGIWPFTWSTPAENFELHALPSSRIFELDVTYDYGKSRSSVLTEFYSRRSDQALAECGETVTASIKMAPPAGARDISCAASWVDTSGLKHVSQRCQIKDNSIEGDGAITGLDKVCSTPSQCTCPEYGNGWLQIDGSYKITEDGTENMIGAKVGRYSLPAESDVSIPIDVESGAKLGHIGILVRRALCPAPYDHLDLFFPEGVADVVKGASKNAVFHATYSNGQMVVRHSTSESTVGDADPN